MATKTQYAAVLSAIKSAPNSIGVEMIATRAALSQGLVRTIVSALCETRHIKENGAREGTFFTRTPMRAEIDAFLAAQAVTLTGINFGSEPGTTTSTVDPLALVDREHSMTAQALLYRIFSNPTSHTVTNADMERKAGTLIELGLVRRHRDDATKYFTVPAKRDAIRQYIDGVISWSTLIGENTDHNPGPVVPVTTPPTSREGVWVRFPAIGDREYRADAAMSGDSRPFESPYYYGNYEESYKEILKRIRTAPNAIDSTREINATLRLVQLGFLRVHRDDNSKLFTNPAKRQDIDRYLAGEITIKQLFGIDPMPTPAPTVTNPASLLRAIRNAPESVAVPICGALDELLALNLIREHRDKPGFYFTEPSNRDVIDSYSEGDCDWYELVAEAEERYSCPCCVEEPYPQRDEATCGNPDILALAQAVRNLADVIIRANS